MEATLIKTNNSLILVSDEEIKEGNWVYCTERKLFGKVLEIQLAKFKSDTSMLYFEINNEEIWCKLFNCKKIILTTDEGLINDGVHEIDDNFLEWLVKNPSCEEVKVVDDVDKLAKSIVIKNNPNGVENMSMSVFNGLVNDISIALRQAKSETIFSLEDMNQALLIGARNHISPIKAARLLNDYIQSLIKPKEYEFVPKYLEIADKGHGTRETRIPKIVNNKINGEWIVNKIIK